MNRVKKHIGAMLSLILLMICFTMAAYHAKGQTPLQVQNISLKRDYISGSSAISMQEEQERQENPIHFTTWGEAEKQTVTNKELVRTADVPFIFVKGDSNLVYPSQRNLPSYDLEGCIIDEHTAYKLFGDHRVSGQTINWNEKDYIIRDVVKNKDPFVLIQADAANELVMNKVAVDVKGMLQPTAKMNEIASRLGVDGNRIDMAVYHKWGITFVSLLPLLMLIQVMIPMVKEVFRRRLIPVKGIVYGIVFAAYVIGFIVLMGLHFKFPEDLIPTRWSDFEFWTNLYKDKSGELAVLLKGEKSIIEMITIAPFLQVVKYMICALIIYGLFVKKLLADTFSSFLCYTIISMMAVFFVIKGLGTAGRNILTYQTLWFLPVMYLLGKAMVHFSKERDFVEEDVDLW